MEKTEVIELLKEKGFKPLRARETDAVLVLKKCAIFIDVTVRDENIKAQIDGKEVLKFPKDRYEIVCRAKDKVISSKTGFDLSTLSDTIDEFIEIDEKL